MNSTDALTILQWLSKHMIQKKENKCDWCEEDKTIDVSVDGEETFVCHDCFYKLQDTHIECGSCWVYDSEWFEPEHWPFICWLCRD